MEWKLKEDKNEWEEIGKGKNKRKKKKKKEGLWKMKSKENRKKRKIGSYDGYGRLPRCEPHDLPGCLPSNQCQESWHKGIGRILKGKLRGSLEVHPRP